MPDGTGPPARFGPPDWDLRQVPEQLVERYRAEGWWTDETLGTMIASAIGRPSKAELVVHSRSRPWRGRILEVDRAARSFAASLRATGLGPGDVVALQLPNWVEAATVFWGACYLGAVVVPIVHFYGPKEVAYILDVTRPRVLVTPARFGATDYLEGYASLVADRPGTSWLVVGADGRSLPPGATEFAHSIQTESLASPVRTDPNAPAVVAFTSGTTQNPKGVVHSHRTLGFEVRQLDAMAGVDIGPTIAGAPVGHFIGMLGGLLMPLLKDQPIHLIDVWDPGDVLRIMLEEKIAMAGGAAYFVISLLDHPDFTPEHLAFMPYAGLGGSPVPLAVTSRLASLGVAPYRSYGSTEHPSITGCSVHDPEPKRLATDGRVLPGVEIRLDENGEIYSRGPDLFVGYTDEALTRSAVDRDGWYRTGDVGILDDEGYLTITDRVTDVIIRGGENISAQEIEELLLRLPAVAEVAVVSAPDERLGERAAAVVRSRPGSDAPTLEEVRTHLSAAGLAKQKWPEYLYEVSEFPRTPSGKIQKFKLRAQLRDGRLDHEVPDAASRP